MNIPSWLLYILIAFSIVFFDTLVLLYTEFSKRFRRKYLRYFIQPSEEEVLD